MKIIQITPNNVSILKQFISNIGTSGSSFRYYHNRNVDVIKNHIVTLVGCNESNIPIAYGHLDKENSIIWLGICVSEKYVGMGFGSMMMQKLIEYGNILSVEKVKLSVDRSNSSAISMYKKFGFKLITSTEKTCFFILNINN